MDVAGYCETCDRWFACVLDDLERFVCAWCGKQPIRVKGNGPRADSVPLPAGKGSLAR